MAGSAGVLPKHKKDLCQASTVINTDASFALSQDRWFLQSRKFTSKICLLFFILNPSFYSKYVISKYLSYAAKPPTSQ